MIAHCLKTCRPAGVWRVFEVAGVDDMAGDMASPAEGGDRADAVPEMSLRGCSLVLRGRDITSHLAGARRVGIMACMLGMDSERELRALSRRDPLDGLIFDAGVHGFGGACGRRRRGPDHSARVRGRALCERAL